MCLFLLKFLNYWENIWDYVVGVIVVEEVGGCVFDIYGKLLNFVDGVKMFENRGIVVSNKIIYD